MNIQDSLTLTHQVRLRKAASTLRRLSPLLAAALNYPERKHRPWTLQHRIGKRQPVSRSLIVPDRQPSDEDVVIASRLLVAHQAAQELGPPVAISGRIDSWAFAYEHQHKFANLLARGDPSELAGYLCNVWRHDAAHGIAQGDLEFDRIRRDAAYRRFAVLKIRDKLISLAEAVGAAPVENPEPWPPTDSFSVEQDALVEGISRQLGIDIAPPDVDGGLLKLVTSHGLFGERDLYAIFTANLTKRALMDESGLRVCEIGGGSGRAAYWACRMGLGPYTLIDLPHINVVQGYYLAKTLGGELVSFYGEDPDRRIRVLPNRATAEREGHDYDLVLNQDSFPEMHPGTVRDYLTWMGRTCRGGLLLSVNHESKAAYGPPDAPLAQPSVPEVIADVGGFELLLRYPYWLRRGYVTELYRVAG